MLVTQSVSGLLLPSADVCFVFLHVCMCVNSEDNNSVDILFIGVLG